MRQNSHPKEKVTQASSVSRIWSRGGAKNFFRDFADVAKQSPAGKENNIIFQYKRI